MKNYYLLMNKADESQGGGGDESASTEQTSTETSTTEEDGDDFYDKPEGNESKGEETKSDESGNTYTTEEKIVEEEKSSETGYETEEKIVEEQKTDETTEATASTITDEDLKDLQGADKEFFKKFATDNKLTKEQTAALVTYQKTQYAALETFKREQQNAEVKQRNEWRKELREDKDFGGDKLKSNLNKVDKLLISHFPSIKKDLTDNKAMLPPTVMKELAKVADLLNGTEQFVHGSETMSDPNDPDSHLDFYKN